MKVNKILLLPFLMGVVSSTAIAVEPVSVAASGDDGNVPSNTLDDDLSTRWSVDGDGNWITYELDSSYLVETLEIAFYKGDERTADFEVQLSDDGSSWTTAWSGEQPELTTDLQSIDIDAEGNYLRVVGYGNSVNDWNSITEINIVASTDEVDETTDDETTDDENTDDETTDESTASTDDLDSVPEINCTIEVSNASDLESNTGWSMSAGTTVCLTDGTYEDIELSIGGDGTEDLPITVAAQNPGSVFFEGESQVRMSGSYIVFQGVTFQNGNSSSSDLFQTRGNGDVACNNCRITEVTITDWDETFEDSNRWFLVYGEGNRIDHGWFTGKTNRGSLLTVDRSTDDADYAQIDHNYFGNRPPADGQDYPSTSDNEYEAVRIGTSGTHEAGSYSRVEYNYFEKIQGEAEIISNKSSYNVITHNTIRESYGSIVNRHGSNTEISYNFMFADDYAYAGGIRLTDSDHQVFNNHIEGCSFEDSNFNGGIVLTDSDGSSDSGYQQVDNVLIAHNTFVNCVNSINLAGGKSDADNHPTNITMINNVVADAVGSIFVSSDEGIPEGSTFANNYVYGESFADGGFTSLDGFTYTDPLLEADSNGLYRPSDNSPVISGGTDDFGDFSVVELDMDGQARDTSSPDSGADELSTEDAIYQPLTADDVGPINYQP